MAKVLVVGAGLAGSECAYFLAEKGISVILAEAKTIRLNPAQKIPHFAELVCTNSLKSKDPNSAHGLLKTEMNTLGSLILQQARKYAVPAGDALAVDREKFSKGVTEKLKGHPLIEVVEANIDDPIKAQDRYQVDAVVMATGPLTTDELTQWLQNDLAPEDFYFYDAIAPVVDADSLDYSKLYFKNRHADHEEEGDYLNAPMNEQQYYQFIEALRTAETVAAKNFEDYKFFEACLPIDLMAQRGVDTPRFSCMKPIGLELTDGTLPYAVVQLRKENLLGDAFNLVGFQTRLTYPEQKRIFRMIPGLEKAEFIHLGSVHRNSYLNAPKLLNPDMSSKKYPNFYFAGQISGVEGYTESAAMGLYVGHNIFQKLNGKEFCPWPKETAIGALVNYLMTQVKPTPSNINFGLLPSVVLTKEQRRSKKRKRIKKELAAAKAQQVFREFYGQL